ncbi:MAG: hypothetical protein NZ455_01955 [Bacteroidia bacterium]|nr:hypothetical protein [Bacteroidia bacterium]MDW8345639.1 hypothetical protein [Bacteroidia bacterium]
MHERSETQARTRPNHLFNQLIKSKYSYTYLALNLQFCEKFSCFVFRIQGLS